MIHCRRFWSQLGLRVGGSTRGRGSTKLLPPQVKVSPSEAKYHEEVEPNQADGGALHTPRFKGKLCDSQEVEKRLRKEIGKGKEGKESQTIVQQDHNVLDDDNQEHCQKAPNVSHLANQEVVFDFGIKCGVIMNNLNKKEAIGNQCAPRFKITTRDVSKPVWPDCQLALPLAACPSSSTLSAFSESESISPYSTGHTRTLTMLKYTHMQKHSKSSLPAQ